MYRGDLIFGVEFDFVDIWWFEDIILRFFICVYFYFCFVDGWVDDDLSIILKFIVWWNVDEYWMVVYLKFIDNYRIEF